MVYMDITTTISLNSAYMLHLNYFQNKHAMNGVCNICNNFCNICAKYCFDESLKDHIRCSLFCSLLLFCNSLQPFQCGDRFYTSESDVCRCQILTYKDGPRTERLKIFLTAVHPYYSNIGIQVKQKELTKTFVMISN